jgi:hypothetical protein
VLDGVRTQVQPPSDLVIREAKREELEEPDFLLGRLLATKEDFVQEGAIVSPQMDVEDRRAARDALEHADSLLGRRLEIEHARPGADEALKLPRSR